MDERPGDPTPVEPQPQQAPPPPPAMPGVPAYAPKQTNGLAVASLVLGILTLLLFFTIWLPFILGILAIVFGAVGISKANRGAGSKGLAIAGLVCGAIGIAACILFIVFVGAVANDPEFQDIFSSVMQSPNAIRALV